MVVSLRNIIRFLKMWMLVIVGTILMYQVVHMIQAYLWHIDRYHTPKGPSVQVHASPSPTVPWYITDIERIESFILTGE